MACDAASLISTGMLAGYGKLSERDLLECIVAAACAGGGGSGLNAGGLGYFSFGPGVTLPTTNPSFPETSIVPGYDIEQTNSVTISWPNLTSIDPTNLQGGYLNISGCSSLTTISMPKLSVVGGSISGIINNPALTSLQIPLLSSIIVGGLTVKNNPLLTSFLIPNYRPAANQSIDFRANGFDSATINGILHDCVLNPVWGNAGESLDTSGGTNAAPSGQGIADKATLIGRGASITTN